MDKAENLTNDELLNILMDRMEITKDHYDSILLNALLNILSAKLHSEELLVILMDRLKIAEDSPCDPNLLNALYYCEKAKDFLSRSILA